eukprot:EG_transcript_241
MPWKSSKLLVHVACGQELSFNEEVSPVYVHLAIRDQFQLSRGVPSCSNPVWNEDFTFHAVLPEDTLDVKVCFSGVRDEREPLGLIQVPLRGFLNARTTPVSLPLPSGSLAIQITATPNSDADTSALSLDPEDTHALFVLLAWGENLERYQPPCITFTLGNQQYTTKATGQAGSTTVWNAAVEFLLAAPHPDYLLVSVHSKDLKEPSPIFQQIDMRLLQVGVPQELSCTLHCPDSIPFSPQPRTVHLCAILANVTDPVPEPSVFHCVQLRVLRCHAEGGLFTDGYLSVCCFDVRRTLPLNAGGQASRAQFFVPKAWVGQLHCSLHRYKDDGEVGSCALRLEDLSSELQGSVLRPLAMNDPAQHPVFLEFAAAVGPWRPHAALPSCALPTVQRVYPAGQLPAVELQGKVVYIQLKGARRVVPEHGESCQSLLKFTVGINTYTSAVVVGANPLWAEDFCLPVENEVTQTLSIMLLQVDGQERQRQKINFSTLIRNHVMEFNIPMLCYNPDSRKWESSSPPCQVQLAMLAVNFGRPSPDQPTFKSLDAVVLPLQGLPAGAWFQIYLCGVVHDIIPDSGVPVTYIFPVFSESRDQMTIRVGFDNPELPFLRARVALQGLMLDVPVEQICVLTPKAGLENPVLPDFQVTLILTARGFGDVPLADLSQTLLPGRQSSLNASGCSVTRISSRDDPALTGEGYLLHFMLDELSNLPVAGEKGPEPAPLIVHFRLSTGRSSRRFSAKVAGPTWSAGQSISLPVSNTQPRVSLSMATEGSSEVFRVSWSIDPTRLKAPTEVVAAFRRRDQAEPDSQRARGQPQLKCTMQCTIGALCRLADGMATGRPNLRIQLIEGRNLAGDQICIRFNLGAQHARSTTKTNATPRIEWNEGFEFEVEDPAAAVLQVHAMGCFAGNGPAEDLGKYGLRLEGLALFKNVIHDCALRVYTGQGWERAQPPQLVKLRLEPLGPPFHPTATKTGRSASIPTSAMPLPLLQGESHDPGPSTGVQVASSSSAIVHRGESGTVGPTSPTEEPPLPRASSEPSSAPAATPRGSGRPGPADCDLRLVLAADPLRLPSLAYLCRHLPPARPLTPVPSEGFKPLHPEVRRQGEGECSIHHRFLLPAAVSQWTVLKEAPEAQLAAALIQGGWRQRQARQQVRTLRRHAALRLMAVYAADARAAAAATLVRRLQRLCRRLAAQRRGAALRWADQLRLQRIRTQDADSPPVDGKTEAAEAPQVQILVDNGPPPAVPDARDTILTAASAVDPVVGTLKLRCRLLGGQLPTATGRCSAYAQLYLGRQAVCSARREHPGGCLQWDEEFTFCVRDPAVETLDLVLYHASSPAEGHAEAGRYRLRLSQLEAGRPEDVQLTLMVRGEVGWQQATGPVAMHLRLTAIGFGLLQGPTKGTAEGVLHEGITSIPMSSSLSSVEVRADFPEAPQKSTPIHQTVSLGTKALHSKSWEEVLQEYLSGMQHQQSLVDVYDEACRAAGMRPNGAARNLFHSVLGMKYLFLKELSFANNCFGDKGVQCLCTVLTNLPSLQSLDLRDNFISTAGLTPLVQTLSGHPTLRSLDLRDNDTVFNTEDAALLLQLVRHNCRIQTVLLDGTGLMKTAVKRVQQQCALNRSWIDPAADVDPRRLAEAVVAAHMCSAG